MQNYVKNARVIGMSDEEIRQNLLKASWAEVDIDKALLGEPPAPPSGTVMPGPIDLLTTAFDIYKQRAVLVWKFLGILAILATADMFLFMFGGGSLISKILMGGVSIFYGIGWYVAFGSWIKIADLNIKFSFREAATEGLNKFWSMALIAVLTFLVTMGGFFLLVIPGLIFSIYFFSPTYVLFHENLHGRAALLRSKQLVKGNWWKIFWRMTFMVVMGGIVGVFVALLIATMPLGLEKTMTQVLVNYVIYFLVMPVEIFYTYALYKHLAMVRPVQTIEPVAKLNKYVVAGAVGLAAMTVLVILAKLVSV